MWEDVPLVDGDASPHALRPPHPAAQRRLLHMPVLAARGYASLAVAVVLEVGGTVCMRLVGPGRDWWRIPAYVLYAASFSLFPWIVEDVPLTTAYATWSALGTAVVALIGVVWFGDALNAFQTAMIATIVVCTAGVHLAA